MIMCVRSSTTLKAQGIRAEADIRNEKINYKVREHSVGKVPVILAVGMKEVEDGTVSMRRLGEKHSKVLPLDEVAARSGQGSHRARSGLIAQNLEQKRPLTRVRGRFFICPRAVTTGSQNT